MLLLFSVSAIIPLNIGPSGGEMVFEGKWDESIGKGYVPLRHLNQETILVWDYSSNGEGSNAPWKSPLPGSDFNQLRLVLEPNLPDMVVERIYNLVGGSLELRPAPLSNIITITANEPTLFTNIPGILWIEPILETTGRNIIASEIMQTGTNDNHPFWNWGLNGSGVIIGVADGGIDLDHSCFRNATAIGGVGSEFNGQDAVVSPSPTHRKILLYNSSIDGGDTPGHMDYRHGTQGPTNQNHQISPCKQ
jgi:subtilisin family serine protease